MKKEIPEYSQYLDVALTGWEPYACGVVSLRMITDYYHKANQKTSIDTSIKQGLILHAYIPGVGWAYKGLIKLAKHYGCGGFFFDWKDLTAEDAYKKLSPFLAEGPVMVSVPKDFKEKNSSHLVILKEIKNDMVFILDPASHTYEKISYSVTLKKFLTHWKKRALIIRPNIANK